MSISINTSLRDETIRTKQSQTPRDITQKLSSKQIFLPIGISSSQYEINKEIQDILNTNVLNILKSPCISAKRKMNIGRNYIKMQKQIILKNNAVTKIMNLAHERFMEKYRESSLVSLYGYYQINSIFEKKKSNFTIEINELRYDNNTTEYLFKFADRRESRQIMKYLFTAVYNYDYKTYNKKINEVLIKNMKKILITYSLISNYYPLNNNNINKINLISNLPINKIPNIIPNYFPLITDLYKIIRNSIMKQKFFKLEIKNIKIFNEINSYKNESDKINDMVNANIYQNFTDEDLEDYSSFAEGEEIINNHKKSKKKIDITANQENNFYLFLEEIKISEEENIKNEQKNRNLYEINKYNVPKYQKEDNEISINSGRFNDNEMKDVENLISTIEENESNNKIYLVGPNRAFSNKTKNSLI